MPERRSVPELAVGGVRDRWNARGAKDWWKRRLRAHRQADRAAGCVRTVSRIWLHALFLTVLVCLGCGDEAPPYSPDCPIVTLEGTVLDGEGPVEADLLLNSVATEDSGAPGWDAFFLTSADAAGHYQFHVPAGSYILSAWSGRTRLYYGPKLGGTAGWADTLKLIDDPVRADFRCGSLHLLLQTPSDVEGEDILCVVSTRPMLGPEFSSAASATAAGGRAEMVFRMLRPGLDWASVQFEHDPLRLRLPATYVDEEAATVRIREGETTEMEATIPSPATISGEIHGSWEQICPEARPRIELYSSDDFAWAASWQADPFGAYRVRLFAPMLVRLRITIAFIPRWVGGSSFYDATAFLMEPGREFGGVSIRESGIRCRLRGSIWNMPREALLLLEDPEGNPVRDGGISTWSAEPVALPNLGPGTYYLKIAPLSTRETWLPFWYDGQLTRDTATPIVISEEGEVVEIVADLLEEVEP